MRRLTIASPRPAPPGAGAGGIGAVEAIEHEREIALRDAAAAVAGLNTGALAGFAGENDFAAARRVTDGVRKQVTEDLQEALGVDVHAGIGRNS
jgi:GTP cyclohydrolase III